MLVIYWLAPREQSDAEMAAVCLMLGSLLACVLLCLPKAPQPTGVTACHWDRAEKHCINSRDVELSSPCLCLTEVPLGPAKVPLLQTGATRRVVQKMRTVPATICFKAGLYSKRAQNFGLNYVMFSEKSCNRKSASGLQSACEVFREDVVSPSVTSTVAWSTQPEHGLGVLVCQWVSLRKTRWEKFDLFCTR